MPVSIVDGVGSEGAVSKKKSRYNLLGHTGFLPAEDFLRAPFTRRLELLIRYYPKFKRKSNFLEYLTEKNS